MKEEDIRPTELMMENQRLRQEDAQDLIKNKHDFVKIPCPACESDDYEEVYQKEGFEMKEIVKDFFLYNYDKPIYENGIQCKHMIILNKNLKK